MNSIKQTLKAIGTREEIASECGVAPIAVYRWEQSGSIPARHFSGVLRVARRNGVSVTADYLSDLHDQSPSSVSKTTDFLPTKQGESGSLKNQGETA